MGYKPGTGLGKQKDARTEPINISIKNNRSGLGREAVLAELTTKRHELRRAQLLAKAGIESSEEISVEAYRRRATQKAEERKQQYDVKHCQQTCESLDLAADVQEPELEFFWPPKLLANSSSELTDDTAKNKTDLEEQEEPSQEYNACEQLELLTTYLRTAYRFCYWCGTRYESTSDMEASCPGLKKDDH
ncbi:CG10053 [Drosophila busckii]|uniref:G patch domain-containing protein 11 n=2 Tax=Drosophila busckii TaxID=30019 RepID=A0A0M4F1T8_DROBS|nr:CG10053 [Drosophila busckii]